MDLDYSNGEMASSCQRLSLKRKRRETVGVIFGNGKNPLKRSCSSFQFSLTDLGIIFNHYSCGTEFIESKGMLQFCKDLNVDTMDVALLVLSFQLNVSECGVFTKQEFVNGLSNLRIYSMSQLKEALPGFREYALTHLNEIYVYAFHSLKEYESQLTIPLDGALEMIRILTAHLPHGLNFINYMKRQNHEYLGMNFDQWTMFLQFNLQISMDFENYDENGCWPVMIDDFVLFMRSEDRFGFAEESINYYESSYDNQCYGSDSSSGSSYSPFSSPFNNTNSFNNQNDFNNNDYFPDNNLLFSSSTFNNHPQSNSNINYNNPFSSSNNNYNQSFHNNANHNNFNNDNINNYFSNSTQINNSFFSSFNSYGHNTNNNYFSNNNNNNSYNNQNNGSYFNNNNNNQFNNNNLFSSNVQRNLFSNKEDSDSSSEICEFEIED